MANTKSPEIVIVGAGLSGFSAAAKLMENGCSDITLLEAEDRIGGRVHSVPYSNGLIDMGGQWCHGERGNSIYELVHDHYKFGRSKFLRNDADYLTSSGEPASQEKCLLLESLLEEISDGSIEGRNESFGAIVEAEYMKIVDAKDKYKTINRTLVSQILSYYQKEMNVYYASESWFDISALYDIYGQECEGNQMLTWNTDGFKKVFDFITVSLFNVKGINAIIGLFRKGFPILQSTLMSTAKFS